MEENGGIERKELKRYANTLRLYLYDRKPLGGEREAPFLWGGKKKGRTRRRTQVSRPLWDSVTKRRGRRTGRTPQPYVFFFFFFSLCLSLYIVHFLLPSLVFITLKILAGKLGFLPPSICIMYILYTHNIYIIGSRRIYIIFYVFVKKKNSLMSCKWLTWMTFPLIIAYSIDSRATIGSIEEFLESLNSIWSLNVLMCAYRHKMWCRHVVVYVGVVA